MVDFRWMRAIDRLLCLDGALTLLLAGDSQVVASTNSTRSRSRRVSRHEYERLRSTWRNDDDELLFFFCGVSRRNNALGDWLISVGRWHTHTHTYYVSSAVEHDWKYSSVCNGDTRNAQKWEERKSCAMRGPNPVTSRNEMSRPEYLYRLCGLCVCVCAWTDRVQYHTPPSPPFLPTRTWRGPTTWQMQTIVRANQPVG